MERVLTLAPSLGKQIAKLGAFTTATAAAALAGDMDEEIETANFVAKGKTMTKLASTNKLTSAQHFQRAATFHQRPLEKMGEGGRPGKRRRQMKSGSKLTGN